MHIKRKRDSLIAIGDAVSGLVPAHRKAAPQALHHFTQADQVDQLVWASEADSEIGFMARLMALCSLPRTNPGNQKEYKRVNGPYQLYMIAGGGNKLPFGNLPRLLLAWVSTEAVRTQSRELVLGRSLSEFMRSLGVYNSGGQHLTRLRNQMKRLFACSVQLTYKDANVERFVNSPIAESGEYWWNPQRPDEPSLWDSKIRLGEAFFQEIIRHPIPLDMNTPHGSQRSTLGLDFVPVAGLPDLHAPELAVPSLAALYRQFGADPAKANNKRTVDNFRTDCLRELKKIKTAWPGLKYTTGFGLLILSPSKPAIPRRKRLRLVK